MTSQPSRLRTFGRQLRGMSHAFGGAVACAAATEAGKRPSRAALEALGINADSYYGIDRG